jgi:BlaI family penicillinase repressor
MKKDWSISDSEWWIMKCLWKRPFITIKEIHAMLLETKGWNKNMVRSLIVRLLNKGVIGANREKRYFRYYPTVSRHDCIHKEMNSFIDRVFDGCYAEVLVLVSSIISSKELSEEEQGALMNLSEFCKVRN